jgi:hypothetical protein
MTLQTRRSRVLSASHPALFAPRADHGTVPASPEADPSRSARTRRDADQSRSGDHAAARYSPSTPTRGVMVRLPLRATVWKAAHIVGADERPQRSISARLKRLANPAVVSGIDWYRSVRCHGAVTESDRHSMASGRPRAPSRADINPGGSRSGCWPALRMTMVDGRDVAAGRHGVGGGGRGDGDDVGARQGP